MAERYPADDPRAWIAHARSDLILAGTPPPSGVYLETLCFHAQQAAEKAIKAVVMHLTQREAAFTHNLRRLIRNAERAGSSPVPLDPEQAQALTGYAVDLRYPDDLGDVDESEWQRAVEDARRVLEWAVLEVERER